MADAGEARRNAGRAGWGLGRYSSSDPIASDERPGGDGHPRDAVLHAGGGGGGVETKGDISASPAALRALLSFLLRFGIASIFFTFASLSANLPPIAEFRPAPTTNPNPNPKPTQTSQPTF